jgi:hypothetical protein
LQFRIFPAELYFVVLVAMEYGKESCMLFVCLSSTVATLLGFCVMQGGYLLIITCIGTLFWTGTNLQFLKGKNCEHSDENGVCTNGNSVVNGDKELHSLNNNTAASKTRVGVNGAHVQRITLEHYNPTDKDGKNSVLALSVHCSVAIHTIHTLFLCSYNNLHRTAAAIQVG